MYPVSHIAGRTRLKFDNAYELHQFIKNMQSIPGVKKIEQNSQALTALVQYDAHSSVDYVLRNIISKEPENIITKNDISAYIAPLIKHRLTKVLWLVALFGPTVGFLQFSISSMIVNRYIQARFD